MCTLIKSEDMGHSGAVAKVDVTNVVSVVDLLSSSSPKLNLDAISNHKQKTYS